MIITSARLSNPASTIEAGPLLEESSTWNAMETYFQCITTCSLEDGECVTRCVEELRENG
jgi:hypothetical protein